MKFKVGDKVKILSDAIGSSVSVLMEKHAFSKPKKSAIGKIGTIKSIGEGFTELYQFEVIDLPKKCYSKDISRQSWFYREDQLELVKDQPKIDMVVKCLMNTGRAEDLTINKYYPVIKLGKGCTCDQDDELEYTQKAFKTFKVGDRFKWECENNVIYVINEFRYICGNLTVSIKEEKSLEPWINWKMESFDKAFTKIEPTKEKEPVKQEELQIGDYVEILSDAIAHGRSIVEQCNVESAIGKIGLISKIQIKDNIKYIYVSNLPDKCYRHVNSYYYQSYQLKKVDKPEMKPEWQPKFKIGVEVIRLSDAEDKAQFYYVQHIDRKENTYLYSIGRGFWNYTQVEENDLISFKQIQELKDQLAAKDKEIAELREICIKQAKDVIAIITNK